MSLKGTPRGSRVVKDYDQHVSDRRRADAIHWSALGASLATRGEPRHAIERIAAGRSRNVVQAITRGYDSALNNRPDWPPKGPETRGRKPRERFPPPPWLDASIGLQRRQTERLLHHLRARVRPGLLGTKNAWQPDKPRWKSEPETPVSYLEFECRVLRMGLTMRWFARRNGRVVSKTTRITKSLLLILDREELLYELACLMDDKPIIRKDDLYPILRRRFEKLP